MADESLVIGFSEHFSDFRVLFPSWSGAIRKKCSVMLVQIFPSKKCKCILQRYVV